MLGTNNVIEPPRSGRSFAYSHVTCFADPKGARIQRTVPTVLLVAYHFPPLSGSSGLQRTLRFAQYLPEFGWKPIVLTVRPDAYEQADEDSVAQIPPGCEVIRTRCLDASRHLAIAGRYPAFAALPDRWASWQWWAVRGGLRACREHRIQALWSTYPIATAHKIGAALAKRTGLPWVADFRDPMAQEGYPADPRRWEAFKCLEESAAAKAARLVFVSPSALVTYRQRYPRTPPENFVLIENGFDDSAFEGLEEWPTRPREKRPMLLHSGIVYPSERDPGALFEALGKLSAEGRIRPGDFVLRFRAPVHEQLLRNLAKTHHVEDFLDIKPPVPYRDALREMLDADALVVMQGASCNEQIPAKLYEYLRAGRPILGLADPLGDTGRALISLGYPFVTPLEAADAIKAMLPAFVRALGDGRLPAAERSVADRYSRRRLTGMLARLLDEVAGNRMAT
jgi:glycosyltransferase involved in cell wall biosynthesis